MTPAQLRKAVLMFRPKTVYPYHYSETPISDITKALHGTSAEVRIRNFK